MAVIEDARWLVAGLGNPGSAYIRTRHNVGFAVVERLAADAGAGFVPGACEAQVARIVLSSTPVLLLKPQTFMNRSGTSVAGWLERLDLLPVQLVVVHDDLDIPVGRLRVVTAAGAGGHRGVGSIQEALKTANFARVRVGIGRPDAGEDAGERVLAEIAAGESPMLDEAVTRAADAVRSFIGDGPGPAMNRYNARPRPATEPST